MVIDFKGVGSQHASSDFLRLFRAYANKFTTNYPEFMCTCFVINAPMVRARSGFESRDRLQQVQVQQCLSAIRVAAQFVVGLWSVVKHWLDPRVAAKVDILGGESSYSKAGCLPRRAPSVSARPVTHELLAAHALSL